MAIAHVKLLSDPVTDPDRALGFYRDVLRFDLINDTTMGPGQRWVQLSPPESLTAAGVALGGEIQQQPWGRFVTFDDPDGNGIVLQETAPGA